MNYLKDELFFKLNLKFSSDIKFTITSVILWWLKDLQIIFNLIN